MRDRKRVSLTGHLIFGCLAARDGVFVEHRTRRGANRVASVHEREEKKVCENQHPPASVTRFPTDQESPKKQQHSFACSHTLCHLSGSARRKVPTFSIDSSRPPFKPAVPASVGSSGFPVPAVFVCRHDPVSGQAQAVLCVEAIGPHETACRNNLFTHQLFRRQKKTIAEKLTPLSRMCAAIL